MAGALRSSGMGFHEYVINVQGYLAILASEMCQTLSAKL